MSNRLQAMGRPEYQGTVNDKGHWTGEINLLYDRLDQPTHWKKPARIFVNSMSDLFHEKVPSLFIKNVFKAMSDADWHAFQVLTKRYNRPPDVLGDLKPQPNIWIGYSVCDQTDADNARVHLHELALMGWNTWVSYEPALEQINWTGYEFIEWLVCGGESGPEARLMQPEWARSVRDWSTLNHVPFYFKQWGGFHKKEAGRLLDGQLWDEYPEMK
jgi:protein gp37